MNKHTSKAQILKQLENKLTSFEVPPLLYFDTETYSSRKPEIIQEITEHFRGKLLAIRSSAGDEDGAEHALAGEYESILSVDADKPEEIEAAISSVLLSYEKNGPRKCSDEFIVQEMLQNTVMSGVVFTHDLNTGAPYYVINYDDVSGLTDTVTSGGGEYANRTLYIHRGATGAIRSDRFQTLIKAIQELEGIMDSQFLDIEFALGDDLTPYLFQVRSITTQPNWNRAVSRRINAALTGIQSFLRMRLKPMTSVYGKTTVLGQMPDWNPAEMIGRAPRALAYSLYKTLITDHAWRIARDTMGYATPSGQALMVSLAGQPFIDTRLSFHSYLPREMPQCISNKLVDHWVSQLKAHPELHDKIEFDIAITTYSFDLEDRIKSLTGDLLTEDEKQCFREQLFKLTHNLMCNNNEGSISDALEKINKLEIKQNQYPQTKSNHINALYEMIDDCINLGTIPFSILARHGFIAQTLLDSLVKRDIFTTEDIVGLHSNIHTVASDLVDDMHHLQSGKMTHDDFMKRYGHLRPGTYDILSPRYDQMNNIGTGEVKSKTTSKLDAFRLSDVTIDRLNLLLNEEGFENFSAEQLLDYISEAIKGREYGKFIFTRSVSEMLQLIENFGEEHGLSKDELSHISIHHILDVLSSSNEENTEERLRKISQEEAEKHEVSVAIRLPQVLFDEEGVDVIPFQVSHPNFITNKKLNAPIVHLKTNRSAPDLSQKIVIIENADPGFDWIFSQDIAGLITKYGGANSHMAIRCAEFGIPAAIGCGEQRFEALKNVNEIQLDCAAGLINSLH